MVFESDIKQKLGLFQTTLKTADFILDNSPGSLKKYRAILDDKK